MNWGASVQEAQRVAVVKSECGCSSQGTIGLLLVDDQEAYARALACAFAAHSEHISLVATMPHPEMATLLPLRGSVSVALVNGDLSDNGGLRAVELLCDGSLAIPTVVLTRATDPIVLGAFAACGPVGITPKHAGFTRLCKTVEDVSRGLAVLSSEYDVSAWVRAARDSERKPWRARILADTLTGRELQILQLLAEGLSTDSMGCKLSITSKTVATHVRNLIVKMGVHSRLQAVLEAQRLGLVPPPGVTSD